MAKTDPTLKSVRASLRPLEYVGSGVFGHYRVSASTGATVGLTANDPILSFRWTATDANAVLLRLNVVSNIGANITTTVNPDLEAVVARSFTAVDSAGTAITLGAGNKSRTSMGSSKVGDIRIATTGKLTAGTRTLDTYGFGGTHLVNQPVVTNVGSASLPVDLYKWDVSSEYPVVLSANEGFIVRTPTAGNTSGSIRYTFTLVWAEVPAASDF